MEHIEHVNLIKKAIDTTGEVWADLGSGEGAFTLALRALAGSHVEIYSVDIDKNRLKEQQEVFDKQFTHTNIHYIAKDFTKKPALPQNSLTNCSQRFQERSANWH